MVTVMLAAAPCFLKHPYSTAGLPLPPEHTLHARSAGLKTHPSKIPRQTQHPDQVHKTDRELFRKGGHTERMQTIIQEFNNSWCSSLARHRCRPKPTGAGLNCRYSLRGAEPHGHRTQILATSHVLDIQWCTYCGLHKLRTLSCDKDPYGFPCALETKVP